MKTDLIELFENYGLGPSWEPKKRRPKTSLKKDYDSLETLEITKAKQKPNTPEFQRLQNVIRAADIRIKTKEKRQGVDRDLNIVLSMLDNSGETLGGTMKDVIRKKINGKPK